MNLATAKITILINDLQTLEREIAIEGEAQQATIARVFVHSIPELIENLRELEVLKRGKSNTGTTKNTVTTANKLHEPRHQAMRLRTIPD